MSTIIDVYAREVLDSRGTTVEVEVYRKRRFRTRYRTKWCIY